MTSTIHLGYEIGSAMPVSIPVRHMAVTGQTQESGKTTTLEALISRSGCRAIAFVTKRGEASFKSARPVTPYFRDQADWQFVKAILESTLRQNQTFKEPWIYRCCEGANSLKDVQRNAAKLEQAAKNPLSKDVYMMLRVYLDKVIPLLASLPKAPDLVIGDGLNVMDLSAYPIELQMLVISSALQEIHENADRVITVIPEAWEFVPEGRNTPVKWIVEKIARKGGAIGNRIWLDSQDMASVDKDLLRAAAVWLIGVQRESNEIERALKNMHVSQKMKTQIRQEVATLELGQFFVAHGKELKKVYVQPAWMEDQFAEAIARGEEEARSFLAPGRRGHETAGVDDSLGLPRRVRAASRSLDGDVGSEKAPARYSGAGAGLGLHPESGVASTGSANDNFSHHELREEEMRKVWTEDELFKDFNKQVNGVIPQHEHVVRVTIRTLLPLINGDSPGTPTTSTTGGAGDAGRPAPSPANQSLPSRPVVTTHAGSGGNNGAEDTNKARDSSAPDELELDELLQVQHETARIAREEMVHSITNLVIEKIRQSPLLLKLSQEVPTIEVAINRRVIKAEGSTIFGKMATLIHEEWFKHRRSEKELRAELVRRGMGAKTGGAFSEPLQRLVEMGFLYRCEGEMYELAPGAQSRVVAA